jgi:hypothetical protein
MFTIFEDFAEGAEFYRNNGSIWLIFTKDKRWVFELTEQGTLWYNYYFFHKIFNLLGMDIEENQHTITEWVENTLINNVGETSPSIPRNVPSVDEVIENRIINTFNVQVPLGVQVKDTIQNGVKETTPSGYLGSIEMKGKIVHQFESPKQNNEVDDIIQNGVKHTEKSLQIDGSCVIEDVIKEGVKHTEYGDWLDGDERLDEIIQNGIKETRLEQNITEGEIDDIIQNGINETWGYEKQPQDRIYEVIKNGIKENPS